MDCTDLRAILSGLVDGELDPALRHEAERHLVDCDPCRARVARAESLDGILREAARRWGRDDALPQSIKDGVLARAVVDIRTLRSARRAAFAGWFAAAAALGLATVMWFRGDRGPAQPDGEPANAGGALADGRASSDASRPTGSGDAARRGERGSSAAPRSPVDARSPDDGSTAGTDASSAVRVAADTDADGEVTRAFALHGPPSWRSLIDERGRGSVDRSMVDPEHPIGDWQEQDQWEPRAQDVQDGVDALFAAAQLLRQIRQTGTSAFIDPAQMRMRLEYDRLVDRLEAADSLLGEGDGHRSVRAAAAMLNRLQHGSGDLDDLREMQEDLGRIPLPERLEEIAVQLEVRTQA